MYIILVNSIYILVFPYTEVRRIRNMVNTNGWTMEDFKTFHDLKVKANLHNLENAINVLQQEVPLRAEQMILRAYYEGQ